MKNSLRILDTKTFSNWQGDLEIVRQRNTLKKAYARLHGKPYCPVLLKHLQTIRCTYERNKQLILVVDNTYKYVRYCHD